MRREPRGCGHPGWPSGKVGVGMWEAVNAGAEEKGVKGSSGVTRPREAGVE